MISGSGTIGVDLSAGGLSVADNSRAVRLFKITSGANPYTATEVVLSETSGTRDATDIYDVSSSRKELWEVNGNTKVKPGRVVIGFPNPAGLGFFFDADGLAPTARIPIDLCVIKSGGNVTDIKATWLNADGTTECETVPECVSSTCDELWWCTTEGVVRLPVGTAPDPSVYYSGPYLTYADALAACDADSGGPDEPGGGTAACCSRALNTKILASLSGGYGTIPLVWDGTYWSGNKALSCGETLYLRYSTACVVSYSCNGSTYLPAAVGGGPARGSVSCGPPLVDSNTWTCNMDGAGAGCAAGSCGSVDVIEVAE